jgi:1,4-alpha-glucan branching enzyme
VPLPYPSSDGRSGIPAPNATAVQIRFALFSDRDRFNPSKWRTEPLASVPARAGWWEVNLDTLGLGDGTYEYEFLVDTRAVPDPFAEELTRFGGYRALFHMSGGRRKRPAFAWEDEPTKSLPGNHQIVIYEMPVRWMDSGPAELDRQVGLATFDLVIFERLDRLAKLGINAIELLPVQDSPDTLNWGYGTRFFFAPDFDMGTPVDLKYFVKLCHRRGIRVLLDVVMNHAAERCPLVASAYDMYFVDSQPGRDGWGGKLFRYDNAVAAQEFHCTMADFWIREYHVDGFRLDEFKSINHWAFVQTFREQAWTSHQALFPGRPFIVIAEDSNRRFEITRDDPHHPNGRKLVDAIWNFAYRDEGRRVLTNQVWTRLGQTSRSERVRMLVKGSAIWEDYGGGSVREGYGDMAQSVNYLVSHDVKDGSRLMNEFLGAMIRLRNLGTGDVQHLRTILRDVAGQVPGVQAAHAEALDRCRSAFALLLTSVGIPMFLAGEEFGDAHDLYYWEDTKMSDPVDWARMNVPGHADLLNRVGELVSLRSHHPALQRNDTSFDFPWPWGTHAPKEVAPPGTGSAPDIDGPQQRLTLSLAPFQIRVLEM